MLWISILKIAQQVQFGYKLKLSFNKNYKTNKKLKRACSIAYSSIESFLAIKLYENRNYIYSQDNHSKLGTLKLIIYCIGWFKLRQIVRISEI